MPGHVIESDARRGFDFRSFPRLRVERGPGEVRGRGGDSARLEPAPDPATDEKPAAAQAEENWEGESDAKQPEPAEAAATPKADTKGEETRTIDVIAKILKDNRKPVRDCYEKALKDIPTLKGDMVIHFQLNPEGKIKKIELNVEKSTLKSPAVADCAIAEIKKLTFPPSSRGMDTTVNYPYNLNPLSPQTFGPKRMPEASLRPTSSLPPEKDAYSDLLSGTRALPQGQRTQRENWFTSLSIDAKDELLVRVRGAAQGSRLLLEPPQSSRPTAQDSGRRAGFPRPRSRSTGTDCERTVSLARLPARAARPRVRLPPLPRDRAARGQRPPARLPARGRGAIVAAKRASSPCATASPRRAR